MEAKLRLKKRIEENRADEDASDDDQEVALELKKPAFAVKKEFKNRERTLVFCSRGVTSQFRHLMDDVRRLLPHHKKDAKLDSKGTLSEITEICDVKRCNSCVFFESRKRRDLYMWVSRMPDGPSVKFHVLNIHTMDELKLTGNSMMGSRPLLQFDKAFDEQPYLQLLKELFTQIYSTPKGHPKSKPFVDHILSFNFADGKIWFRNYQILDNTDEKATAAKLARKGEDPIQLVEIGPRMVLNVIRIFDAPFGGQTLYHNAAYISPNDSRRADRVAKRGRYADRVQSKQARTEKYQGRFVPRTGLEDVFGDEEEAEQA